MPWVLHRPVLLFQSWVFHYSYYVGVCCGIFFLLAHTVVADISTSGGSVIGASIATTPWCISLAGICAFCWFVVHARDALCSCSPTSNRGCLMLLKQQSSNYSINMVEHTALWALQSPDPNLSLHGREGSFLQVWYHPMTLWTLNMWWKLNVVILVWWLGIRVINLLTLGDSNMWKLNQTFYSGLQVRYQLAPTSAWTSLWGLFLFRPSY